MSQAEASEFLSQLPQWLQPGVSPGIHTTLRVVLLLLNALLLTCAILRILAPHFAIMFVLSVGLTISYFMFMTQLEAIKRDTNANSPSPTTSRAQSTASTTTTSAATLTTPSKRPRARASEKPEPVADGAQRTTTSSGTIMEESSPAAQEDEQETDKKLD